MSKTLNCPNCGVSHDTPECPTCGYKDPARDNMVGPETVGGPAGKIHALAVTDEELGIIRAALVDFDPEWVQVTPIKRTASDKLAVILDKISILEEATEVGPAIKCTNCGYVHHMKDGNCPACKTVVNKK